MATNNRRNILAICHQRCCRKTQQPACRSRRANAIFYFEWSKFGINIALKSFHTLFCPIYALDACLQGAGGAGPPKWELRSCIRVYLGHSLFHSGRHGLVRNPNTGRVSPQYHVLFDDDFSPVPLMEAGTIPTNWEDLVK